MKRVLSCAGRWAGLLFGLVAGLSAWVARAGFEPLTDFEVDPAQTARLSRTLSLLRSSGPTNRPVVRVVFYGQSITIYPWWQEVAATLRSTYPYVRFEIQNLAISGFMTDRLSQACDYDVIPAQPDLVILHAYGWESSYDTLLRKLRQGTTADILVQRDHLLKDSELMEETDPARLAGTNPATWEYKNYVWLPRIAEANDCAVADVRGYWKRYCRVRWRFVHDLLADHTHPNEEGNRVMAASVLAYLLPTTPTVPVDPWGGGRSAEWSHRRQDDRGTRRLLLEFRGTRVDALTDRSVPGAATVRVDGRAPSAIPEIRGFRRATAVPRFPWPAITVIESRAPRLAESWTLTVTRLADTNAVIEFRVDGSVTGFDGVGSNRTNFVSNSGRVVIPAYTWLLGYALNSAGIALPPDYRVRWNAEWVGLDALECAAPSEPGGFPETTLVAGLPDGWHRLELEGEALEGLRSLRVFRPAGGAEFRLIEQVLGPEPLQARLERVGGRYRLRAVGGEPGAGLVVETSSDLVEWKEVGPVTVDGPEWHPDASEALRVFRVRAR